MRCAHACVVLRATCECECGGLCSRCELTFPFLKFLHFSLFKVFTLHRTRVFLCVFVAKNPEPVSRGPCV